MKKILAAILATCLLTISLAGCTSKPNGSDSQGSSDSQSTGDSSVSGTLSILSWYNETLSEKLMTAYKKEYPDVKVDYTYSPPVADYVEKLSTLLYSSAAPDVFYMCLENRENLIKGKYALDLSSESYMVDGTIPDSVKTTYGSDGQAFALAVDCWVGGIFYNKDMFTAAGITSKPQTWAEFLEVCQKLQDSGVKPLLDNCQDAAVNFPAALFGAETYSKNKTFTDEVYAGTKTFEEGWTQPVNMWKQLIDKNYITSDMVGITSDDIVSQFATGQVAMILSGSWNSNTIAEINPDLNYECMGIPGSESSNIFYNGAINVGLSINANAKEPEVAKSFLSFVASPDGLKAHHDGYGGFMVASGYEPEVPTQLADAVAGVKAGNFYIPMGEWKSYTESLRLVYIAALQDTMIGKITPEQVGKQLDSKLAEMSKG